MATAKTAAKKPAAKAGTAVALKSASLPANYDQDAAINAFKNRLAVSESNKIQVTQDKYFKVPVKDGDAVKEDVIYGIIVDFAARKNYYDQPFDRDNPIPPQCHAIGFVAHDSLLPAETALDAQSDTCKTCAQNKFVQQPNGKWSPKECKDSYRLAILAPDDDGEGRLMTLEISSTGIKAFDTYVRSLAKVQKTPFQVVTEFFFDPDSEYPSVRCAANADVPKNAIGFVLQQQEAALQLVSREPNLEVEEQPAAAKGKGGKALPKPAARRKAA